MLGLNPLQLSLDNLVVIGLIFVAVTLLVMLIFLSVQPPERLLLGAWLQLPAISVDCCGGGKVTIGKDMSEALVCSQSSQPPN